MRKRRTIAAVLIVAAMAVVFSGLAASPAIARGTAPKCSIRGTAGPDVIHGTSGPDVICGAGGDDVIYGAAGDDRLYGGAGGDRLFGGSGDDFVDGGPGTNFCPTGSGDRAGQGCAPAVAARPSVGPNGAQPQGTDPSLSEPQGDPIPRPPMPITPAELECPVSICGPEPPADTNAPSLMDLSLTPDSIDVSEGPTVVTLGITLFDETSVKGGSITIQGPTGAWRTIPIEPIDVIERAHGNYVEIPVPVPASTPVGRYAINEVSIEDGVGNAAAFDGVELQELVAHNRLYGPLAFDVYAGPDTVTPTLRGLTMTPSTVDTSTGKATVDLKVDASDDLSGVRSVEPTMANSITGYPSTFGIAIAAGSPFEGTWEAKIPLPAHSRAGTYRLESLTLTDRAGNEVTYDEAELTAMGLPTRFTQVDEGDTVAPEILGFEIEPGPFDIWNEMFTFLGRVRVRDDLSGFGSWPDVGCSRIDFTFAPPGSPRPMSWGGRVAELVSGTEEEGEWLVEIKLPPDAPVGTYQIEYVQATDRACNSTVVRGPELQAEGWADSFEFQP